MKSSGHVCRYDALSFSSFLAGALRHKLLRLSVGAGLIFGVAPLMAFGASPVLHFSDLTWGPSTGWQGSTSQGAAVTVWGENLGSTRGSSYITVNGAQLTADADYAEWGAAGPARSLQRITFWLNSNCTSGAGTITVNVNGVASNALPFSVAAGTIYFVSVGSGNDSNNGLYATASGGSNGPFRDIYMFNPQYNPSGDGQYIVYVEGGTYSTQDPAGDGDFVSLRGPYGSATKQKALIAYPGQTPVLDCSQLTERGAIWPADYAPYGLDSYYTVAKLTFENGSDGLDNFGDYIRIVGNDFESMLLPIWSGVVFAENTQYLWVLGNLFNDCGATSDGSDKHNVYSVSTSLSVNQASQYHYVGWNEFANAQSGSDNRGGVVWARTDSGVASQFHTNHLYYNDNYFHGGNQDFVELGDGPALSDIWIYNNVFTGGPSVNSTISIEWTLTNANLFNNSFYNAGNASVAIVDVVGSPTSQLASANNIFYGLAGQPFFDVESGSTMTSTDDLFFTTGGGTVVPSETGLTVTGAVVGDPLYVAPASGNFALQSGSPAINAGTSSVSSIVTEDYDGVPRPQNGAYDIGAFEYSGSSGGGGGGSSVTVSVLPTSVTLGPEAANRSPLR